MSQTIWKYPLEATHLQPIAMPRGARILCVQTQGARMHEAVACLWAAVDPDAPLEARMILVYGTGEMGVRGSYIGTFQVNAGSLVFHVFEDD